MSYMAKIVLAVEKALRRLGSATVSELYEYVRRTLPNVEYKQIMAALDKLCRLGRARRVLISNVAVYYLGESPCVPRKLKVVLERLYDFLKSSRGATACVTYRKLRLDQSHQRYFKAIVDVLSRLDSAITRLAKSKRVYVCFSRESCIWKLASALGKEEFVHIVFRSLIMRELLCMSVCGDGGRQETATT
jgi:hypothetical protein